MAKLSRPDVVVVGAGLFGLTVAERCAASGVNHVLVLERRSHIGGNAWSELDEQSGIEYHAYGTHVFHTDNGTVFRYLNRFTTFTGYTHRVWTISEGVPFSLPINLHTLGQVYGKQFTPFSAREFLQQFSYEHPAPRNFEEKAISLVGPELYRRFIQGYTNKQWGVPASELPAKMMGRVPVRFSYDSRYFTDLYQGMPTDGYQAMLSRMANSSNIEIRTEVDFLSEPDHWRSLGVPIVYSGPIDELYGYRFGGLGWRTVDLKFERRASRDFQGTSVLNYADGTEKATRTHEFRHLHPERPYGESTLVAHEFSRFAERGDEPYYPINAPEDRNKLGHYRALAKADSQIILGGRLGSYQYLDMHMAVASALSIYANELAPRLA